MTNKKALLNWTLTVTLIVFLAFLSACKTTTEPDPDPDPEPPREPEPIERVGTKEFSFTILHRGTDEELTGYDIDIDGPVSASESDVSTAVFTLADVVSGEYTITVSLDGFVSTEVTEELEVPTEESVDFFAEMTIALRQMTPPVQINNSEATTVKTGKPDVEDAEEDEAVSIAIPANTFPASVVKADGTVDVSVTREKPSQPSSSEEGVVSESIILTPAVTLNNPVTITIPIRVIEGLEDAEYFLEPGNIPLTAAVTGNFEANIKTGVSTDVPEAYQNFGAEISEFRIYRVRIGNYRLDQTEAFSAFINIANGQCGADINHNYRIVGTTNAGIFNAFGNFRVFRNDREVPIIIDGEEGQILRAQARHKIRTYRILRGNTGTNVFRTLPVNIPIVNTNVAERIRCHDSGGV